MISALTGRSADPAAIRQELSLNDPADIRSSTFLRFIIRLSERLDLDIPREDYAQLATVDGSFHYIRRTGVDRVPSPHPRLLMTIKTISPRFRKRAEGARG